MKLIQSLLFLLLVFSKNPLAFATEEAKNFGLRPYYDLASFNDVNKFIIPELVYTEKHPFDIQTRKVKNQSALLTFKDNVVISITPNDIVCRGTEGNYQHTGNVKYAYYLSQYAQDFASNIHNMNVRKSLVDKIFYELSSKNLRFLQTSIPELSWVVASREDALHFIENDLINIALTVHKQLVLQHLDMDERIFDWLRREQTEIIFIPRMNDVFDDIHHLYSHRPVHMLYTQLIRALRGDLRETQDFNKIKEGAERVCEFTFSFNKIRFLKPSTLAKCWHTMSKDEIILKMVYDLQLLMN